MRSLRFIHRGEGVARALREGDADGPLLLPMAELKRMLGFTRAEHHIAEFRANGRTEVRDGVEYLSFPVWKDLGRP